MSEAISVALSFRAFDLHELLIHSIARELGYYRRCGLQVSLRDLTFLPDDSPDVECTVGCGGALLGWVRGIRQKIVFVATDYPMFWLYAAPRITNFQDLRGARIAAYPAAAPPEHFHRAILRKHGIDPEKDVAIEAARDDLARLGLLKSGDVSAAVLSSAIPPAKVQVLGFRTLAFFGDEIRVPTTGLAVSERLLSTHPAVVEKMCQALADSLEALHHAPELVIPIIAQFLSEPVALATDTYELLHGLFTKHGRAAPQAMNSAMEMLNAQLPPEKKLQQSDIYDYSHLPG